jgi:6-phospho-beta-glucosidase
VTRIAVLGGSAVSTPQLAAALAAAPLHDIQLALAGRSAEKLRLVAAACRQAGAGVVGVSEHTDPDSALEGADYVLSQVRIGGLDARAFDETFTSDLGLPGEETVGPGGFASAWRALPVVRGLLERCRAVAPDALVLNLTNPASMVHQVATRVVGVKTITLCDAPIVLGDTLAELLGVAPDTLELRYSGMNHCGWITRLTAGGRDLFEDAVALGDALARLVGTDLDVIERLRAIPNPYLRYFYHPDRQLETQRAKGRARAEELRELERRALAEYAEPETEVAAATARRPAPWYPKCVVPLLEALEHGTSLRTIVNVANGDLLPFLPRETTVEVSTELSSSSVEALPRDELPVDARAILQGVAAFDTLAVDAILAGDRVGCVRAVAAHPLVTSIGAAREVVARVERRFGPLASDGS